MCGVFLQYRREFRGHDFLPDYRALSASIAHRGPDAMGVAAIPGPERAGIGKLCRQPKEGENQKFCPVAGDFFGGASGFLGHHRLAIIDTSPASIQPLVDAASQVAIACNGELYNYVELREELKQAGHQFETASDTEVALKAYLAWDTDCFARFNGDYAMLFYDHRKKAVIGARDRLGVKPLFYHRSGQAITFASELKGFTALSGYRPALNEKMAYLYLVADFPTEETLNESFLRDVLSVPAAHWFQVDRQDLRVKFHRYWQIAPDGGGEVGTEEAVAAFDAILSDAVKIRLRSDVPVGSFLSGGLDSPSLVWHSLNQGQKLPTFSSIFSEPRVDETAKINVLVRQFGLDNYQQAVDFEDFVGEIEALVFLQDEPFSTLNVYTQYQNLCQAKERRIKVMLDGGGADEFMAGYADFFLLAAADSGDTRGLEPAQLARYQKFVGAEIDELRAWCAEHEKEPRTVNYINPELRKMVRGDADAIDRPLPYNYKQRFNGSYLMNGLRHATIDAWMNKSIGWDNRYLDRSGMWLGVEARVPFQDHRLIELVFSLPPWMIFRDGLSKYVLRQAMRGRIPDDIMFARKKIGFEFPFCALLRGSKTFQDYFRGLLADRAFATFAPVRAAGVAEDFQNILDAQNNNYNLWRVFNLYLWSRQFVKA